MRIRSTFRPIISLLLKKLDKQKLPSQEILAAWFDQLCLAFEKEEQMGNILYKTWYQTAGGRKLTEIPIGPPLYKVKTLSLPNIKRRNATYKTEISETHFVSGIFPETIPEIIARRLDLIISGKSGKQKFPPIQFEQNQILQPEKQLKHDIRFADGRELKAREVEFIKSVFDAAIAKLDESKKKIT